MRADVAALLLALALPAQAQPAADCREARAALRDMGLRAAESQALREACGLREPAVMAEAARLEEQVLLILARIAPEWPNDAVRTDLARARAALHRQYRTGTAAPIRPESCAGEEAQARRLARLAEARAVLDAEARPGGALACVAR